MATKTAGPARTNGRGARHSADPKLDVRGPELQRFGTLRTLPIGLPETAKARAAGCSTRSWPTR